MFLFSLILISVLVVSFVCVMHATFEWRQARKDKKRKERDRFTPGS